MKEYTPKTPKEWKSLSHDEQMEETIKYYELIDNKATPGMWCMKGAEIVLFDRQTKETSHICMIDAHQNDNHWNDRKFILIAHTAFPQLIAEIQRLQKDE